MKAKNRIYCPNAGRSKLLFETEKKAMTFIKFNAEEMLDENGYAPDRAYFCECCGGWHVTHQKYRKVYDEGNRSTSVVVERYQEQKRVMKEMRREAAMKTKNAVKVIQAIYNTFEECATLSPEQVAELWDKYQEIYEGCKAKKLKKIINANFKFYGYEM